MARRGCSLACGLVVLGCLALNTEAFLGPGRSRPQRRGLAMGLPAAAPERVVVLPDAAAVGTAVWAEMEAAAAAAIDARGSFALAIPGGSILGMLEGHGTPAWAKATLLAYVNHKCVAMDDGALATHAKATQKFLGAWDGVKVLLLEGGADAPGEAAAYTKQLRAAGDRLPLNDAGFPVFDLCLIGVGDDGHVGSLYPEREEVLEKEAWVLPVEMKEPGSITLSMPVMRAARKVIIAAAGVSEKYPMGKSSAMKQAVEGDETLETFPASGLRDVATYYFDEPTASQLSATYGSRTAMKASIAGSSGSAFDELLAIAFEED